MIVERDKEKREERAMLAKTQANGAPDHSTTATVGSSTTSPLLASAPDVSPKVAVGGVNPLKRKGQLDASACDAATPAAVTLGPKKGKAGASATACHVAPPTKGSDAPLVWWENPHIQAEDC